MEENENIVTLIDENDEERDFEIIVTLEMEGKEYTVLLPLDGKPEEEEEAYVFRIEAQGEGEDEDDFVLVAIEDDEEHQKVVEAYESLVQEQDDNEDEE